MTQLYDSLIAAGVTATGQQTLMSMIRKLAPAVLAHDILGTQPMSIGTGHMFTIKTQITPRSKYKFSRAHWYEADHRYDDYDEVIKWCTEQFGPRPRYPDAWTRWCDIHIDRIRFRDQKDYNWFVLRWGA